MKPKFIETIQLGVLLAAIAIVVGSVMHSYEGCKSTVDSFGYSLQASSGMTGPLGWIWGWFTWFTYLFFIGCVALVAVIVLHALGVVATLIRLTAKGIVWVRGAWSPPPLPMDTVVDHSADGRPITLRQVLIGLSTEQSRLTALTQGLEPPPPPKTAEQVEAEKNAEIAQLKALNRKLVTQAAAASAKVTA